MKKRRRKSHEKEEEDKLIKENHENVNRFQNVYLPPPTSAGQAEIKK